jgi:hypothetical protein
LCCASASALAACGDDDSGNQGDGDGGVVLTLDEVTDRLGEVDDSLTEIEGDIDGLSGNVDELTGDVDGLGTDVSDLDMRVADLENPELVSCSAEEQCIPDGIMQVATTLQAMVERLCELELNCCSAEEINYKFGPSITTVAECTETFVDLINNGFTPSFLSQNGAVINMVVTIAQALNDPTVREEFDADAVEACLDSLDDRECPEFAAPVTPPAHCETAELEAENPCHPMVLLNGLQEEGELCHNNGVPECGEGLVCRHTGGTGGICAAQAVAGDRCRDDDDCDTFTTNLFCNARTGECQERGDVGDDCTYVDADFGAPGLFPTFFGGMLQNPEAVAIECTRGTICDPATLECVPNCSNGSICSSNAECPDGHTCNFTETFGLRSTYGLGACRPALAMDAPCTVGTECASGRCQHNGTAMVCFAALKAEGEACTVATAGIGQFDATCESGFCAADSTSTTAGKCAVRCNQQSECAATHYCNTTMFVDSTHAENYYPCDLKRADTVACSPLTDPADPAALWHHIQCASGFCNAGACQAKVAAGAACPSFLDAQCPDTQYCNVNCTAFVAASGACVEDGDCGPGNECFNLTCRPLGAAGASCAAGEGCQEYNDITCTTVTGGSQCQPAGMFPVGAGCAAFSYLTKAGESLFADTLCAGGWCRSSDSTCADPIAAGGNCDVSSTATNRCAEGTFCKFPLNMPGFAGQCTAQATVGQECNPRYSTLSCPSASGGRTCASSCLGEWSCNLQNDQFLCGELSVPASTLFCDGT